MNFNKALCFLAAILILNIIQFASSQRSSLKDEEQQQYQQESNPIKTRSKLTRKRNFSPLETPDNRLKHLRRDLKLVKEKSVNLHKKEISSFAEEEVEEQQQQQIRPKSTSRQKISKLSRASNFKRNLNSDEEKQNISKSVITNQTMGSTGAATSVSYPKTTNLNKTDATTNTKNVNSTTLASLSSKKVDTNSSDKLNETSPTTSDSSKISTKKEEISESTKNKTTMNVSEKPSEKTSVITTNFTKTTATKTLPMTTDEKAKPTTLAKETEGEEEEPGAIDDNDKDKADDENLPNDNETPEVYPEASDDELITTKKEGLMPTKAAQKLPTFENISKDEDDESSGGFLKYFLVISLLLVIGYMAYHNKSKIYGMIFGRRHSTGARFHRL
jgi:hypothetical protein